MKACPRCRDVKPPDMFPQQVKRGRTIRLKTCKACYAARRVENYAADPSIGRRKMAAERANKQRYPAEAMVSNARRRAKKSGVAFDITAADVSPLRGSTLSLPEPAPWPLAVAHGPRLAGRPRGKAADER